VIDIGAENLRMLQDNLLFPADLLIIRRDTETDATANIQRSTSAPFDITHDGVTYRSGQYPLRQLSLPDRVRVAERGVLQLAILDPNWTLRDEMLRKGHGHLLLRFRVVLMTEDGAIRVVLHAGWGHCVQSKSELSDAGPVSLLGFAMILQKISGERAVVVSADSERQRDPKGNSMKFAHEARSLRWSH